MARRDDLAKRLADRLEKSPNKGQAMGAPAGDAEPVAVADGDVSPSVRSARRKQPAGRSPPRRTVPEAAPVERARRGAPGTVLRGHLVPDRLHREARRRKVELGARRASRVTWDEVMVEAVSLLLAESGDVRSALDELRQDDSDDVRRRLVQATLPGEVDRRFALVHLELADDPDGPAVTLEQLWAVAVMLWLRATG